MNTTTAGTIRCVLAISPSGTGTVAVLDRAASLASAFDARVVLAGLAGGGASFASPTGPVERRIRLAETRCRLGAMETRLRSRGATVESTIVTGPAAEGVLDLVRRCRADVVIAEDRVSDPGELDVDTLAWSIARSGVASLLTVRGSEPAEGGPICVALDGSARSEWGIAVGARLARRLDAGLLVVYVLPRLEMVRRLPLGEEERELRRRPRRARREPVTAASV